MNMPEKVCTLWRDRLEARFAHLNERVDNERANLSDFRKIEAEALALTQEESAERRELLAILLALDNEGLS